MLSHFNVEKETVVRDALKRDYNNSTIAVTESDRELNSNLDKTQPQELNQAQTLRPKVARRRQLNCER